MYLVSMSLAKIFNTEIATGTVAAVFRQFSTEERIKKPGLDSTVPSSYRLVSNLSTLSKLLERMVSSTLVICLTDDAFFRPHESAYRKGHSVETALTKVPVDLAAALDGGNFALLALLDLSAAFDTVDHAILLARLETSYGITDICLTGG